MARTRTQYWTSIVDVIAVKRDTHRHPLTVAEGSDPVSEVTGLTVTTAKDAEAAARTLLAPLACEGVVVILLDNGNKIMGAARLALGVSNQCAIYPRNIFAAAILSGASSIILAHNHPGNSRHPSNADWNLTEKIFKIGHAMDIPLLDHIVITDDSCTSMREDTSRWLSMR